VHELFDVCLTFGLSDNQSPKIENVMCIDTLGLVVQIPGSSSMIVLTTQNSIGGSTT
jgi:hypothetical protein